MEAVCRVSFLPRNFSLALLPRTPLQPYKSIALSSIILLWILQQQLWQHPHTSQHLLVAAHKCPPTLLLSHRPLLLRIIKTRAASNMRATRRATHTTTKAPRAGPSLPATGVPTPSHQTEIAIPAALLLRYLHDRYEIMPNRHRILMTETRRYLAVLVP